MILAAWGISAAGSAPRWQRGGHGFEPRMLHEAASLQGCCFFMLKFPLNRLKDSKRQKTE